MKNYVCAIFLLMYIGLPYSATQVLKADGCLYGDIIIQFGTIQHFDPCIEAFCNWDGRVSIIKCASRVYCHLPYQLIGIIPADHNKNYPYCCEQPICQEFDD